MQEGDNQNCHYDKEGADKEHIRHRDRKTGEQEERDAYRPRKMQAKARKAGPMSIAGGTSRADAAASERGSARKIDPNALTKQAAERALVRAKRARQTSRRTLRRGSTTAMEVKRGMKIRISLANPFSGGECDSHRTCEEER